MVSETFQALELLTAVTTTSCTVFACIHTYPFLATIVVLAHKHAKEKEEFLLLMTR